MELCSCTDKLDILSAISDMFNMLIGFSLVFFLVEVEVFVILVI